MAVSEKTRKSLWGRSGNRCAICKHELVIRATESDDESVVGEECHIVSPSERGPRYEVSFPPGDLDRAANLILLCRVHHKMVDDQVEHYSADVLRAIKEEHERWVSSTLTRKDVVPPIRIRRIQENTPQQLGRLASGGDIFAVVNGASGFDFVHDELTSAAEADLVGGFLQEAQDYGDLSGDSEAGERVKAAFELSERLRDVEEAGFWVFGVREVRILEGGIGPTSPFPIALISVVRADNPEILAVSSTGAPGQSAEEDGDGLGAEEGQSDV